MVLQHYKIICMYIHLGNSMEKGGINLREGNHYILIQPALLNLAIFLMPPLPFLRVTLKMREWPGDEATL